MKFCNYSFWRYFAFPASICKCSKIPGDFRKAYKGILHDVGRVVVDYGLIAEGDRVMVAVSGGKDSHALLHILLDLQAKAPVNFSVFAYTLDQKQPGFDGSSLVAYYEEIGVEYHIGERDTYSIVTDKIPEGKTYCSLCSRLRRGILYDEAARLGATKIALGHHANDALETLLLNLFYSGKIAAMPPRLTSDDGRSVVIRPLIAVNEDTLAGLAQALEGELRLAQVPAVAAGRLEPLREVGAVMHQLLRHAAADDAGAADPARLGDPDLGPVRGRAPGAGDAAGAATDHEQVEVWHLASRTDDRCQIGRAHV